MLELLVISVFILSLMVLIIIIKQGWNSGLTLFLTPFLLFNIAFGWYTIDDMWGQARNGMPDDVVFVNGFVQKPWIYVVVIDPKDEVKTPTFHKMPWSKQNEEQLKKGQEAKKRGQPMLAKIQKQSNNTDKQLQLYEWDHIKAMPKPTN